MDKETQLEYLRRKYKELKQLYLRELKDGNSLQNMKDISEVLNCLQQEIKLMEQVPAGTEVEQSQCEEPAVDVTSDFNNVNP